MRVEGQMPCHTGCVEAEELGPYEPERLCIHMGLELGLEDEVTVWRDKPDRKWHSRQRNSMSEAQVLSQEEKLSDSCKGQKLKCQWEPAAIESIGMVVWF